MFEVYDGVVMWDGDRSVDVQRLQEASIPCEGQFVLCKCSFLHFFLNALQRCT
jgi:hypothetical protein